MPKDDKIGLLGSEYDQCNQSDEIVINNDMTSQMSNMSLGHPLHTPEFVNPPFSVSPEVLKVEVPADRTLEDELVLDSSERVIWKPAHVQFARSTIVMSEERDEVAVQGKDVVEFPPEITISENERPVSPTSITLVPRFLASITKVNFDV